MVGIPACFSTWITLTLTHPGPILVPGSDTNQKAATKPGGVILGEIRGLVPLTQVVRRSVIDTLTPKKDDRGIESVIEG